MYTKLHLNDKLKHASGFVSHLLECVASTGISMLFCLASKHADIVSFNGKKKNKTHVQNAQSWRCRYRTNKETNMKTKKEH